MNLTVALALLAAAAVVGALAVTYKGSSFILYDPSRKPHDRTPAQYGLLYEPVEFKNKDGLTLKGWIVPAKVPKTPRRTILLCHGWGTNKAFILESTKFLAAEGGYDLVYFDTRGCGESEGSMGTVGYLETFDLDAALDFLRFTRPQLLKRLGIWGRSMGGAVALVGTTRHPEIRCAVIEQAFSSFDGVVRRWGAHRSWMPDFPLVAMARQWVRWRLGADPESMAPIRHVDALAGQAMFYVSGDRDWLMPVSEARVLYDRTKGPKELWVVPNADHDECWKSGPEEYERRVREFYDKNL